MRTKHGHHIPGTPDDEAPPVAVARCGGVTMCTLCIREAALVETANSRAETVEPKRPNVHISTEAMKEREYIQDNRTLSDDELKNRFGYHKGTERTIPKHTIIREQFEGFAKFLDSFLPNSRAKNVMLTELESAEMWANKAVAEMAPIAVDPPSGIKLTYGRDAYS